jgi:predicted nuclease with RNAse H fold
MSSLAIGIDVHANRSCPYAVVNDSSRMIEGGWIPTDKLTESVLELANRFREAIFAIDAPRMALPKPRTWYWRKDRWSRQTGGEKGNGRHCEIVIAAHRLANLQWTPLATAAPTWMQNGFKLFAALQARARCLEVFPSASYRMFGDVAAVRVDIDLSRFVGGPKDMLDAVVAARTALEYLAGRGQEVGGGDGFGTIVLPRPIAQPIAAVMQWPGA